MTVVLLQGRSQARRETAKPTKASSPEPQGKRERNCTGDLGMTPGQSCTRTPVLSAVPDHREARHRTSTPGAIPLRE